MMDLVTLANETQSAAVEKTSAHGVMVATLLVGVDGSYQLRCNVADVNVLVGVLQRAIVQVVMGHVQAVAPGIVLAEEAPS
jgi:hypothetical protein